jgi:hypothetical protein
MSMGVRDSDAHLIGVAGTSVRDIPAAAFVMELAAGPTRGPADSVLTFRYQWISEIEPPRCFTAQFRAAPIHQSAESTETLSLHDPVQRPA